MLLELPLSKCLLNTARKTLTAFLAILISTVIVSPSYSASLTEVYQLATLNDPVIASAKANYKAGDTIKDQALAALLPSINASYRWTKHKSTLNTFTNQNTGAFDSEAQSVTATQSLFNLQAIFGYRQALSTADQAFLRYADAQQELIIRTAEAYFEVLRGTDNLESSLAEERAIARQLEQTQQRYEVGLIAITDVHEAQAASDLTIANRLALEASLGIAKESLAQLTGEYIEVNKLANNYVAAPPLPAEISEWVELANKNNLNLQLAYQTANAAKQNARVKTSSLAPIVEAFADYSKNRSTFIPGRTTEDSTFGIQANWEIFRGGGKWAERREAQYQHAATQSDYIAAKRSATQQTRSAYLQTSVGAAEVNARQRRVISATSALDATQAGYDAGTRNIVDLLNAQRDLYAAQRDYSNARYDFVINSLRLKRAAGIISAADLESIPTEG